MAIWLAVLFGLISGSVPGMADRRQRLVSILAAFYLLSMLLIWVVSHLFAEPTLEPAQIALAHYGLPAIPLALMLIRVDARRSEVPPVVDLEIFTRWPLSPALQLHLKLLAQMGGYFYEAKRREQIQRRNAYARAIYETGAHLTHDVKSPAVAALAVRRGRVQLR